MRTIPLAFIATALVATWCATGPAVSTGTPAAPSTPIRASQPESAPEHDVFGTIRSVEGSVLSIETRSKAIVQVDVKSAIEQHRSNVPPVGRAIEVRGAYDKRGVLQAKVAQRAKDSPLLWPADK